MMNYQRIELKDLESCVREVIKKIIPNLYNLLIYFDGEDYDLTFIFDDDPLKDAEGYLGECIDSYVVGSPTYNKLYAVHEIIEYCVEEIKC